MLGGNGRIETQGRGYVLHLEPGELDLDRFEDLFAEGRQLLVGGDAASASTALEHALDLWRGRPLADLSYAPFAAVEASRSTKWILVNAPREDDHDGLVGLVVDAVTEVFGTAGEEMRQTPVLGGNKDQRGISGVVTHNGALTFVLDKVRLVEVVSSLVMPESQ